MRFNRSKALNPGRLRERIQIKRRIEGAQDSYGVPAVTSSTVQECMAEVRPLQGREWEAASARWAKANYKVVVHYLSGVTPAMFVIWGSREFNILDVQDPYGDRSRLWLICEEIL